MSLSELETRRLYMDDYVWNRTSKSWKSLKPNRDFNELSEGDESKFQCYERLRSKFDIPLQVVEQWLYGLYYDVNSTNNYGWLNFEHIRFKLVSFSLEQLEEVYVIREYQNYVREGEQFNAYDGFSCTPEDKEYWKKQHTWRVPPIILDVSSLSGLRIPSYAEIGRKFQIVEGHTRLGYLFAAKRCDVLKRFDHKVYLMSVSH